MTPCISCSEPNGSPSATVPQMCNRCWWRLPAPTRSAYASGRLSVKRVGQIAKERTASVRTFGGGRR